MAGEWDGGQDQIKEDLNPIVTRVEEDNLTEATVILPRDWKMASMPRIMEESLQGTKVKCHKRGDLAQA